MPAPTALSSMVRTRKGLAAIFATIVGSIYAVALTVSYFQGKSTPDAYFTHLQAAGGGVMAAWGLYMFSVATEDAGTKVQPKDDDNKGDGPKS